MESNEIKIRKVRNRKSGFFTVDNIFIDEIARFVNPFSISVYMSLCRHANLNTQTCFPSKSLIARETKMGERTVFNSIKKLERLGLIQIKHTKKPDSSYRSNIYTLLDITKWKPPSKIADITSTGEHTPDAPDCKNSRHGVPNKDTNFKETNIKKVLLKEPAGETDFLKALRAGKSKLRTQFTTL